jgi:ATP-dependent protease ClpP protease subunit
MPKKYEIVTKPKGKSYFISIWDNIEEYEEYDKLTELLGNISEKDDVTLNVSTPGGRCDIGFMLIDRFAALPCKVDVIVPYPTYSMGAIMALCGNSLKLERGAFLMFHDYSGGTGRAKGNEALKATEAYCETFKTRFKDVCQPFLSKKECDDVLQGKDLYIKWTDPSLKDRTRRHF